MKICKECGTEVSSKGTCPKCGKDQRIFFIKHKVLTFILCLIILGVAVGATGGKNGMSCSMEGSIKNNTSKRILII